MNTKTVLAVAAAAFVGSATAQTCTSTQQSSAFTALAGVLSLSSFQGCADDSGFSLLYSTSMPTDAQYVQMCASDNCQSLISSVAALNPPDCDLTVPTSGLVLNVYSMASGFSGVCASVSSTTTSTASSAASTTTEAPAATTAAPAATTAATTTSTASSAATEAPVATAAATTATSSNTTSTTTATAC